METIKLPNLASVLRAGFDLIPPNSSPAGCLDRATGVAIAALAALECLDLAIFLVGLDLTVFHVNRAATELIFHCDGLDVIGSRLICSRASDTAKVRQLVQAPPDAAGGASGGIVDVRRTSGHRPLSMSVWPISLPPTWQAPFAIRAIVAVSDAEKATGTAGGRIRQLYGLTAAETRVAESLLDHERLADVAASLGISLATVRTLLQRVFDKTDTHRQTELVRLMLAHRVPGDSVALTPVPASAARTSPPP